MNLTKDLRSQRTILIAVSVLLIIISGHIAKSQYPFIGRCLKLPVQKDFNVERYTGVWYVIEQYYYSFSGSNYCQIFNYTVNNEIKKKYGKGAFQIEQTQIGLTGWDSYSTIATLKNQSEPSKYIINPVDPEEDKTDTNHWILATDYGNYSLIWSCSPFGAFNTQMIWFLSRRQRATGYSRDRVYSKMRRLGINTRLMTSVPQFYCPELGPLFDDSQLSAIEQWISEYIPSSFIFWQ